MPADARQRQHVHLEHVAQQVRFALHGRATDGSQALIAPQPDAGAVDQGERGGVADLRAQAGDGVGLPSLGSLRGRDVL